MAKAKAKVKKEFPYYQMSDEELKDPAKSDGFETETRFLEATFPHLNMNPLAPGVEDDEDRPIPTKVSRMAAGDDEETIVELDPNARQNPDGDVNWVYHDRSDHGEWGHFAFKHFNPGDVILRINHPLVSVPDTPRLSETCSNCLVWEPDSEIGSRGDRQDEVKLKVCTGCKVVKYCGKKCQSESWKEYHKYECKRYAKFQPNILPNTVRLLVRLFLTGQAGNPGEYDIKASPFQRLESHIEDLRKSEGETWKDLSLMAKMVKKASATPMDEAFVIESFARVLINSMTHVTPTYDPIGTCLDPTIAGLNHACDCNAVVSFDGPSIFVRSLRKIKRGEEITISYIDTTNPFAMRQAQLKQRYFFTCACDLCKKGREDTRDTFLPGARDKNIERIRQQELGGFRILELASKGKDVEENVADLERAMESLRATLAFPVYRQPYASLRQQLIRAYLSTQRWIPALAHALKQYFHVDPHIFPQEFHPVRMVHTWVLITLINFICSSGAQGQTMKLLEKYGVQWDVVLLILGQEVEINVSKSHGDSGQFAAMVQRKMVRLRGGESDISIPQDIAQDQWKRLNMIIKELAPM